MYVRVGLMGASGTDFQGESSRDRGSCPLSTRGVGVLEGFG